jgi:hypothetical protein
MTARIYNLRNAAIYTCGFRMLTGTARSHCAYALFGQPPKLQPTNQRGAQTVKTERSRRGYSPPSTIALLLVLHRKKEMQKSEHARNGAETLITSRGPSHAKYDIFVWRAYHTVQSWHADCIIIPTVVVACWDMYLPKYEIPAYNAMLEILCHVAGHGNGSFSDFSIMEPCCVCLGLFFSLHARA